MHSGRKAVAMMRMMGCNNGRYVRNFLRSDCAIDEKTVVLHKKENEGFGFVLRGAKGKPEFLPSSPSSSSISQICSEITPTSFPYYSISLHIIIIITSTIIITIIIIRATLLMRHQNMPLIQRLASWIEMMCQSSPHIGSVYVHTFTISIISIIAPLMISISHLKKKVWT